MKMGNIAKMAQQMQAQMAQVQAELRETTTGGGAVRIVITGAQEVRSVEIDPGAIEPGEVEMLQDLILAAMNDAIARSKQLADERMASVAGSMGLPGMPGLR